MKAQQVHLEKIEDLQQDSTTELNNGSMSIPVTKSLQQDEI